MNRPRPAQLVQRALKHIHAGTGHRDALDVLRARLLGQRGLRRGEVGPNGRGKRIRPVDLEGRLRAGRGRTPGSRPGSQQRGQDDDE